MYTVYKSVSLLLNMFESVSSRVDVHTQAASVAWIDKANVGHEDLKNSFECSVM